MTDSQTLVAKASEETAVVLEKLTVRVPGRTLLEDVSVRLPAGKVSLIIGCSGVGKSVLLRILAGEVTARHSSIDVSGTVDLKRESAQNAQRPRVGVVYQDFALFDELSPTENVKIAVDHSPGATASDRSNSLELLTTLNVPPRTRTTALSGGQKQRLAIARTLASKPDVLLYDEPTSGLDSVTADRVADLIHETHESHPRTSIVVTHDYTSLPRIADAVFVLDGQQLTLREVPAEKWGELAEELTPADPAVVEGEGLRAGSTGDRVAELGRQSVTGLVDALAVTTRVAEEAAAVPFRLLPAWSRPRWGGRYLMHYLRLVCGPSAWIYIAISGLIIGFVATYFTFRFLPFSEYTEPLLIENLLSSIGFALYRILVPVLATILIAARCGAAVASDIGGKSYTRQLDAMRSLGISSNRYLLTTVLYAFLIGTPLLVSIGYCVAHITSLVMFVVTHPDRGPDFWQVHYYRQLTQADSDWFVGTGWLIAKVLTCAIGIGLIAYRIGERPKNSSAAVSLGITRAILWSTLYVLVVHFVFTFFEFD